MPRRGHAPPRNDHRDESGEKYRSFRGRQPVGIRFSFLPVRTGCFCSFSPPITTNFFCAKGRIFTSKIVQSAQSRGGEVCWPIRAETTAFWGGLPGKNSILIRCQKPACSKQSNKCSKVPKNRENTGKSGSFFLEKFKKTSCKSRISTV